MSKAGKLILEKMREVRLGDKAEAITRIIGIKPCDNCKKRKAWLNGEKGINTQQINRTNATP